MSTTAWREANQDKMRAYRREWYARNKAKQIAASNVGKTKQRDRNVQATIERRLVPCPDCGCQYPFYVMEFDHIGEDKTGGICQMARRPVSLARLEAEMDKCEVVCRNCHAGRTFWRRAL